MRSRVKFLSGFQQHCCCRRISSSLCLLAFCLSGCSHTLISEERMDRYLQEPETRLDRRFGSSVTHMIRTQKYIPPGSIRPATVGQQLEGWEAESILKTYHPDT